MDEPFISILTPVYNGESFIRECIESILAQNYSNWEYIIVDNKSTDRTLEIAKEYEKIDSRICTFENKEFLPVVANFNNTVRKISPNCKYVKFVCADDWIYPECLSKMVELAEANPRIGIVSSYRYSGNRVVPEGIPYKKGVFSGMEIARMNLLDGPYTFGSPSTLLIRSEIMKNQDPFYNEFHLAADTEACYKILQNWDFGFVHQILSFSRIHEKSVYSANRYLNPSILDHIYMLQKYGQTFLEKNEYEFKLNNLISSYYRFIGGNFARLRNSEFIIYHKQYCEQLNIPFSSSAIAKGWLFVKLSKLIDTKQLVKQLFVKSSK